MQTQIPKHIRKRLHTFLPSALQDAADTDIFGVIAHLEPAVDELYARTPNAAHIALTEVLLHMAAEYQLVEEMAHIALHSSRHAANLDDDA